jgi:sortase A
VNPVGTDADVRQPLKASIQALAERDESRARELLARVLRLDAQNEWAWYYLSRTMKTARGVAWCLERVLAINPNHTQSELWLRRVRAPTGLDTLQPRVGLGVSPGTGEPLADWVTETKQLLEVQEQQLKVLESRAHERDADLERLRHEASLLQEQVSRGQVVTSQLQTEVQSIADVQGGLAGEVEALRTGAGRTIDHLAAVDRRLSEAESRAALDEALINDMEARLGALDSQADEHGALLDELRRETGLLQEEVSQGQLVTSQLRTDLQSVADAERALADDVDALRTAASDTAGHLGAVDQRLSEAESRVGRSEEAIDDMGARLGVLTSEAQERDGQLDELRRETGLLQEEVSRGQVVTSKLQAELQSVTDAERALADEVDALRTAASDTADHLGAVDQRLSETESRVGQSEEAIDDMGIRLGALDSQAQDRDVQLDEIRREAEALREGMQKAETTAARLQSDTQSVIEAHQRLADELDGLRTETNCSEERLDAFEAELSEVQDTIAQIGERGDELESGLEALEEELASLRPTLQGVRKVLSTLNEKALLAAKNIAGLETQVARLEGERAQPRRHKRRAHLLPMAVAVLGLCLASIGFLQVYPYAESQPTAEFEARRSQGDAGPVSGEPAPWAIPATRTPVTVGRVDLTAVSDSDVAIIPDQAPSEIAAKTEPRGPAHPPPGTAVPTSFPTAPPSSTAAIPTRLIVPDIGLDAPVVPVPWQPAEETDEFGGTWEVPDERAVGWHEDSAPLGVPGNTVLNGHNTTNGEVFRDLHQIDLGGAVIVYSDEVAFTYVVSEILIVPEADQPLEVRLKNASYVLPTEDERLTLMTCHPYGSLRNRLIVIARPGDIDSAERDWPRSLPE